MWLLLAFVGAFGAWAVVADQQPAFTDAVLGDAVLLRDALTGTQTLARWLEGTGYRPPLTYIPASLLFVLLGPSLTVLRLTVLAQYLAAVWVTHDLGCTVAHRRAGLFAAVLVATFPAIFGWGRMAYVDFGLALMVLVCLRLLVTLDLDRPARGARLGLAVGLGLLTKVAFPIFALFPLVWLLAARVRSARHLATVGVAAATAVLVAGPWYLHQWQAVVTNLTMSTGGGEGSNVSHWTTALASYTWELDGVVWLLGILAAGAAHTWFRRTASRNDNLLFLLTIFGSFLVLLQFHASRRYALPIYLVAAAWAGITGALALDQPGRRRPARLGLALLSAALLANFVSINLGRRIHVPAGSARMVAGERVDGLGLLTPDRRDHGHLGRALATAARRHRTCLVALNGVVADDLMSAQLQRLRLERQAGKPTLFWHWPRYLKHRSSRICVLAVHRTGAANQWLTFPPRERGQQLRCATYDRFGRSHPRRTVARFGPSPLGLTYTVEELRPEKLAPVRRRLPRYCRPKRVSWDR